MIHSPAISNHDKSSHPISPISPNVAGSGSQHIMNHLLRKKSPFVRGTTATTATTTTSEDNDVVEKRVEDTKTEDTKPSPSPLSRKESGKPLEKLRDPTPNQSIEYHLAKKSPTAVTQSPSSLDSPSVLKGAPSFDHDDKVRTHQLTTPSRDESDDAKSKKIYEAASRGDFLSLCKSIEDDVNCVGINYKGGYGLTALIISAEGGNVVALRMLIRAGSDVNATSNWGYSGLHRASQNGHIMCVNELISAKANVDLQDRDGWTPLMFAFANGHEECITALVKANANLDIKNVDGRTAYECTKDDDFKSLMTAKIAAYFQEQTQSLNIVRLKQPSVLIFDHLKSSNVQGLKDLLQADPLLINAKLEPTDSSDLKELDGDTPIIVASLQSSAAILRVLLQYKANVNEQSKAGKTALIYSCVNGNVECVKVLMEYNANVNTQSFYGNTALNYAAYYGRLEIVKLLLDAKADVDTANNDGKTALMNASSRGYKEIVDLLLAANADIKLINAKGSNAYDVAKTQTIKDTIRNSSQSRALELQKRQEQEEEERQIQIQEELLIKFRETQSEASKKFELEREQLLKLIRERSNNRRLAEQDIARKQQEKRDMEEKRFLIVEELKKQDIMRAKREADREKEEEKTREKKRKEQRVLDDAKFKSEREALLSLINERNSKRLAYAEHLASIESELSKTKPLALPTAPKVKQARAVLVSDPFTEDSNESEVKVFLENIGLAVYTDFFVSLGADRLSDFHYYASGPFDQIKSLLPEFSVTLKHFHQIRFYDELRKHFNIPALPPASPVRHSPPSQKFVQSSPTNNEFTAVAL